MFMGYSLGEIGSILAMQGFAGLILFSVFLLMALGLAIIFGQMGVINMAHGEFMTIGAYMTYLFSHLFQTYAPRPSPATSSSPCWSRSLSPARSGLRSNGC